MFDYKVIEDPEYGYLRIEPKPTAEEVERFYREDFYSGEYKQFNNSSKEAQEEAEEFNRFRFDDMLAVLDNVFEKTRGLRVFDIGCGYGAWLRYCYDKGLCCTGVDMAPEAVEHLQTLGFDVKCTDLDADLSSMGHRPYDVVTLLNVLEHLREPADMLRRIREQLLTSGGVIVITVPNDFNPFQTVANKQFNLGEWWVVPPNHINYFDPETLRSLLEACGYDVFDTSASFPLEIFLLMGDVYVGNRELGRSCHDKRVQFERVLRLNGQAEILRSLYRALAGQKLGREVTCYARPNPYTYVHPSARIKEV